MLAAHDANVRYAITVAVIATVAACDKVGLALRTTASGNAAAPTPGMQPPGTDPRYAATPTPFGRCATS